MPNDITLQEGQPVDENLRPIKVGGKLTAIETAQHGDGARINGDLIVTGELKGKTDITVEDDINCDDIACDTITASGVVTANAGVVVDYLTIDGQEIDSSGSITLDSAVSITLNADGGNIFIKDGATNFLTIDMNTDSDVCEIDSGLKVLKLSGPGAGVVIDGLTFSMSRLGTEFSPSNSAYAGMILGYTEMAYGTASARYDTTTSFVVINDNYDHGDGAEDHFLGVSFVVPPSNRVEIEVFLPYVASADGTLHLGLATNTSATTLKTKFETVVWDVDESDLVQIVQKWVIDGSDSGMTGGAWSAGESKTLYCMTKETTAGCRLFWGDGFINYGDMIMKATALPVGIGDGT
tara:strand:- start:279 stop:1331 length:1053 start_codon:yes stop_codon:yes gene_type:complete